MTQGDHACLVYSSDQGRRDPVLHFLRAGLQAGEKVVYITEDGPGEGFAGSIVPGPDTSAALASGQLEVRSAEDVYLTAGAFDIEGVIELLHESAAQAQLQGFSGHRVTGEMDWALSSGVGTAPLFDYEQRVDAALRQTGTTALCQYDKRRFDAQTVREVERVHPLVLADEGDGAGHGLLIEPGPAGALILRGEIDRSNSASLARSLEAVAARRDEVRLDLRELSFIDVAGLRAIRNAAEQIEAAGGSLTLVAPRFVVRLVITLLGIDGKLTIEEVE